jgi:alkaline phosphatase D
MNHRSAILFACLERRRFLKTLGALGVSLAAPRITSYPCTLGMASGYPSASRVVLWTRLTGELAPLAVPLRWEVAADEAMRQVICSGETTADPAWAHSARVGTRYLPPAA